MDDEERSGSQVSSTFLSRETESDAMVVEAGSCDLADPKFSNAVIRLEHLQMGEFDLPKSTSQPSSTSRWSRSKTLRPVPSSRSQGSHHMSTRTSPSPTHKRSQTTPSTPSNSSDQISHHPGHPAERLHGHFRGRNGLGKDSNSSGQGLEASGSGSGFCMNPFASPHVQKPKSKTELSLEDAQTMLKNIAVEPSLLQGLRSLSRDGLVKYLQIAEEIKSKSDNKRETALPKSESGGIALTSDNVHLQLMVQKLQGALRPSSLEPLSKHKFYGLLDVVNGLDND